MYLFSVPKETHFILFMDYLHDPFGGFFVWLLLNCKAFKERERKNLIVLRGLYKYGNKYENTYVDNTFEKRVF